MFSNLNILQRLKETQLAGLSYERHVAPSVASSFAAHSVFQTSCFTVIYCVLNSTLLFYNVVLYFTIKYCTNNVDGNIL